MNDKEIEVPFTLTNRPRSVPGDLCPNRRMAILLLILYYCRGKKASHQQIYVMDWAIRSQESRQHFLQYINGHIEPDKVLVRYDPALPRIISLAIGNNLIIDRRIIENGIIKESPSTYRLILLDKGKKLVEDILSLYDELLCDERIFLDSIGNKITHVMVRDLFNEVTL